METPKYIIVTYYIAFGLLLTYFALNYYNEDLHLWFDILEFTVLILGCFAVMLVTCTNYRRGAKVFRHYIPSTRAKLINEFKKLNKQYRERGLTFVLPIEGHYWIEIRLDKHVQKAKISEEEENR